MIPTHGEVKRTLPRAMLLVALVVPMASLFAQAGWLAGQLPSTTAEQIDAAVAQAPKESSTPSISGAPVQEGKIAKDGLLKFRIAISPEFVDTHFCVRHW
ncbi:MAG: hypothetical protein LAO04_12025 [Acidobacteriia bacterium]|nr:hypothetical protein [Terriglobia bacterium]